MAGSLPLWECGLKSSVEDRHQSMSVVTPLVGVWIEIGQTGASGAGLAVTPLVGVWIEISSKVPGAPGITVTPLVGVWIEIHSLAVQASLVMRHSPCGSVD